MQIIKSIKININKLLASGATFVMMSTFGGCATVDEQSENKDQPKVILYKDFESNTNMSNRDKVCLHTAWKEVRDNEAQKYADDNQNRKYAMDCFDLCSGVFVQKNGRCQYIPSKYEFHEKSCLCNGLDIIPYKQREQAELEFQACQKVCKSANTDKQKYEADWKQTHEQGACVCKIMEENQYQH